MRDRTRELTGPLPEDEDVETGNSPSSSSSNHKKSTVKRFVGSFFSESDDEDATPTVDTSTEMAKFFESIGTARDGLATLKRAIDSVDPLHSRILNATSEQESEELSVEMEGIMSRISQTGNDVRKVLKQLEVDSKRMRKMEKDQSQYRVRQTQQAALTKKFLEYMTEYKEVEEKYQLKYKQRLKRELQVVKPDATEDELTKAMQQGGGPIFAQQTLKRTRATDEARLVLHNIQTRHNDILRIEKTVIELQQLFTDMAVLVAAQDDAITEVGSNIAKTVEYTEKGVEDLRKARKRQKKSRKLMCLGVLCLIVVLVIIGVVVLVVLKK